MADRFSPDVRRSIMSKVKSKNTQPELLVRRMLHALGFRFRLHRKDLPGCPDIVLTRYRCAIFVHGCFWHGHENCRRANIPATRAVFWEEKIRRNRERDASAVDALRQLGWNPLVIWGCELRDPELLSARLRDALSSDRTRDA